jgi:hypothetical protein
LIFLTSVLLLIQEKLTDANVFAFGIGGHVNRAVIEALARAGMGEPFVVVKPREAKNSADRFRNYISTPLLQGIELDFQNFETYDVEPKALGDLFAERPLVLFGKYKGEPGGSIRLRGNVPGKQVDRTLALPEANISKRNNALKYLWARHRIQRLTDVERIAFFQRNQEIGKKITELGLKYGLATKYTSFVAVDNKVRSAPDLGMADLSSTNSEIVYQRTTTIDFGDDSITGELAQPSADYVMSRKQANDELDLEFDMELEGMSDRNSVIGLFLINLDPVTVLASSDGGSLLQYGSLDFLVQWPRYEHWNSYLGLGLGYLAPRLRLGIDIRPLPYLFESGEPIIKLGGRYTLAFELSDTPSDYSNFDMESDFITSFMAEMGIGWRFRMLGYSWQAVAMYLVGSAWPDKGSGERAFGSLKPTGSAVFHGGTLSLSLEF